MRKIRAPVPPCSSIIEEGSLSLGVSWRKQRGQWKQEPQARFPSSVGSTDTLDRLNRVCKHDRTRNSFGEAADNNVPRKRFDIARGTRSFHAPVRTSSDKDVAESLRAFSENVIVASILMSSSASWRKQWGQWK